VKDLSTRPRARTEKGLGSEIVDPQLLKATGPLRVPVMEVQRPFQRICSGILSIHNHKRA
jgi:hypothetical protein